MKLINKIRFWIISKLFTYDEKWLIYDALKIGIDKLHVLSITNKIIDYDNTQEDIKELELLRTIFHIIYR
jgi:hypothetical protein